MELRKIRSLTPTRFSRIPIALSHDLRRGQKIRVVGRRGEAPNLKLINLFQLSPMAGKNGGARRGAGRKPHSITVKKVDPKIINAGILPLEMRLRVARHMWDEAATQSQDGTWAIKDLDKAKAAADFAEAALPYTSNRLAVMMHTGADGGAIKHDHSHEVVDEVRGMIQEELGAGRRQTKH